MSNDAQEEIALADPGTFQPHRDDLRSRDPLGYPGYDEVLAAARKRSGTDESVACGAAEIGGHPVELALFNFAFMGGSMGEVTGERLARTMERAAARRVPFVLRTATGGARMQEGMRSLIQMPKLIAARMTLAAAHQPFLALLGHPTMGGVWASLAALADVTLAEQDAAIGFAGPRIAERVTGRALPPGSHTAAFARDNGMVDAVVAPDAASEALAEILDCVAPDDPEPAPEAPTEASGDTQRDPWEIVQDARKEKAAIVGAWERSCTLSGDRAGDPAISLGSWIVRVGGRRALVMDTGGVPLLPSGFRKAMRCVEVATRLSLPIVTLVDTPGADPSADSEGQGVTRLMARLAETMLAASVPILSVITGEGGSGGAMAFATADVIVAYEGSIFSVIAPEGAAEILWRDAARAPAAARLLKLTAHDLKELGIADHVVAGEPGAGSLRQIVAYHLGRMTAEASDFSRRRRERWRDSW